MFAGYVMCFVYFFSLFFNVVYHTLVNKDEYIFHRAILSAMLSRPSVGRVHPWVELGWVGLGRIGSIFFLRIESAWVQSNHI